MNPFHHPPEETARQQVRQAMEQRRAAEATAGVIAAQYDLMQHVAKRQRGDEPLGTLPSLSCAGCRRDRCKIARSAPGRDAALWPCLWPS